MGWTGGDSGNEVGFVLVSLPPEPDSSFLLLVLQWAFCMIAPLSNLPTAPSPPFLCSVNRWTCVLIQYVPLGGNNAQCPESVSNMSYLASFSSFHTRRGVHMAATAVVHNLPPEEPTSVKSAHIDYSIFNQAYRFTVETQGTIFSCFYSTKLLRKTNCILKTAVSCN